MAVWPGLGRLPGLPDLDGLRHGVGAGLEGVTDLALDRKLRLAITGLRHSGKTVFTTCLVHHLLQGDQLPFLDVVRENRLVGARLLPPGPDDDPPPFPFEAFRAALADPEPRWPAATERLTALRLALRFRPKGRLRRQISDLATLKLEITDYPGEWLLDLPLLERTFEDWSAFTLDLAGRPPRRELAAPWLEHLRGLDPGAPASDDAAARLAALYTAYLRRCQDEAGLHLVQPGRFTQPGELAGSPLLPFCPLPPGDHPSGGLHALMARRFDRYRRKVVRRFYRDHFSRFDRQIVLIDLFTALNRGPAAWLDLRAALGVVLASFRYGRSGLLSRLFSPRIDRVLFAATKADHVAHNQHHNLRLLLERLVADAAREARFEGVTTGFIALAALRCTDTVRTDYQGQSLSCVRGVLKDEGRETVLFPGEIPPEPPDPADWPPDRFRFRDFAPRRLWTHGVKAPQHVRLDQALQFLVGDRLE